MYQIRSLAVGMSQVDDSDMLATIILSDNLSGERREEIIRLDVVAAEDPVDGRDWLRQALVALLEAL